MESSGALIAAEHISKTFPLPEGRGEFTVLDDVSFHVAAGEVVALLGRSGSGKSTLLRILAGLIAPTQGTVYHRDIPLHGVNPDVAMVFQNFALLPWLTVQDNVELGLAAIGVNQDERRTRALKVIDMVGLDGFENAYPKELSGGGKQRVGFARAFVVQPQVLLMDEPFSALDVLTAENLRGEIANLWQTGMFPAKSILMVTHNIEEAVLLADRVVIFSINPGRVRVEIPIDLPRPRERDAARFKLLVDEIYTIMTSPESTMVQQMPARPPAPLPMIPDAHTGEIGGLLEMLSSSGGRQDIPIIAGRFQLAVDELLPIIDAAVLLGFAEVKAGDVCITEIGKNFAGSDIEAGKAIFRQQVQARVPLVSLMVQTLQAEGKGVMRAAYFLELLEAQYTEGQAERQLTTAIAWGRYAELFEYDDREGIIRLSR